MIMVFETKRDRDGNCKRVRIDYTNKNYMQGQYRISGGSRIDNIVISNKNYKAMIRELNNSGYKEV